MLETLVEVIYPEGKGSIGLRGNIAPLSWDETRQPDAVKGDASLFRLQVPEGELLELKIARGDDWAMGHNYMVHAGDHLHIEPTFDQRVARLEPGVMIDGLTCDVLLPPGYDEHPHKRYAVLYALDAQSLWAASKDPFGVWELDNTVTELAHLGAIDDLIVVGIHTAEGRLEMLSPVTDAEYGGGQGPEFLERIVTRVMPEIDAKYRTRRDRESTGILGSSMGGLFSFFAAWTRPDVFGKAACLSSSFWWANRWAVKQVINGAPPSPRPLLYLDSGAARSELDERHRDGFHHTRSMVRALTRAGLDVGTDVHRLVFPGHTHNAASWASRIALPLQLLFPRSPMQFDEQRWA